MRPILLFAFVTIAVTACKKNADQLSFNSRATNAGPPFVDTVTLPLIINSDRFLGNDTLYILDGKCYVTNNAYLIIQEGSRIEAKKKSTNDAASALIITRGSRLYALATPSDPIVFTSNETNPASGDWGGIVLLGNAPLNVVDQPVEGINLPAVPAGVSVFYGGGGAGLGDPHDSSGELQFVLIEYAGIDIAQDNELNGLTCAGVGDNTILDYIEVAYAWDDAFEFFGGTVNAKHLFALSPRDDAFDFDLGYTGKIQFAVSVLDPTISYSANPNGVESDNYFTGAAYTPYTKPVISNMTVIGMESSIQASLSGLLSGAQLRRNSSYQIRNSIFMGFPTGVRITTSGFQAEFSNNIVHAFTRIVDPSSIILGNTNAQYLNN
ncbi:MAG TPA: hypothetical protein VF008_20940, partial [Niastella sp.]